jgi:NAD(P)-dependent dehydrogenase (short-subunit alcohol dehydrogenase family)
MTTKTFLITGVSTGLGQAFAHAALDAGHTVVGTLRRPDDCSEFEARVPGRAHAVLLDITDPASPDAVDRIERTFGSIDVLVNNAGFGVEGTFEETPIDAVRRQFEVNVFGTVALTQAVLPHMRARRAGTIVFVTSVSGLCAIRGLSAYSASKFALEGFADALRMEVAPFGIHVMSVEPGGFRTEWTGQRLHRVERSIPDYDEQFEPIRQSRLQSAGTQVGDPAKAGVALLAALDADEPPGHLLLGSDAVQFARTGRRNVDAELDAWEHLSISTDHTG